METDCFKSCSQMALHPDVNYSFEKNITLSKVRNVVTSRYCHRFNFFSGCTKTKYYILNMVNLCYCINSFATHNLLSSRYSEVQCWPTYHICEGQKAACIHSRGEVLEAMLYCIKIWLLDTGLSSIWSEDLVFFVKKFFGVWHKLYLI